MLLTHRLVRAVASRTPDWLFDRLPGDLRDTVAHRFCQTDRDRRIIAGYAASDDMAGGWSGLAGQDALSAVFVRVPKTGSMSVCAALLGDRGGGHRTVRDYKRIYGPAEYRRRFSFSFVRDPYTRLVSAYTYLKRGGLTEGDQAFADKHLAGIESFESFVLDWLSPETIRLGHHFPPQTHFVCDRGRIGVDFVGRFERLGDGFDEVVRRLGAADEAGRAVRLPHINKTGRTQKPDELYTPEARVKVAELYADDFETFGYAT